ncbi:hypothetical protein F2Q68_00039196 [Brassica cretica]|uniref:Uncharacterized protein n=1 Tax=Brassica cretica TaxID=69181 RepID=A0A8S9MSF4_BRACR|nr:hypothetical protein F2Q68_00039196 [Brassica cretica]
MVATIVLIKDADGYMHDQDGHLRNAARKEQMDDVKAKLDSVHKLLKKQASFAEDVEAVDVDNDRY